MTLGDLSQRHSTASILDNLLPIDIQPRTPNLPAPQLCPAHARPDTLDDDAPLQFRHRRHDDNDRPTKRSLSVYRLALREELNPKSI